MKKIEIRNFASKLKRKPESNKYDYGHVLVIAGSKNMPGAGILCCNGAMRSGAGLVTYAVEESFLNSACSMSKPETMFFVYKKAEDIIKFIKERKVKAAVIGPGLQSGEKTYKLIKKIISSVKIPVVLDASGLASFNDKTGELRKVKSRLILTPHTGEFSKLINKNAQAVNEYKEKIVSDFSGRQSLICVLKGHKSIVSDGKNLYVNDSGTPAMATAGSGDVLSGVIAAFACIDENLFEAVKFAVFAHGLSGEISEKDKGACGVTASDIADNMCYAIKSFSSPEEK